jgi:hypothetical protein
MRTVSCVSAVMLDDVESKILREPQAEPIVNVISKLVSAKLGKVAVRKLAGVCI